MGLFWRAKITPFETPPSLFHNAFRNAVIYILLAQSGCVFPSDCETHVFPRCDLPESIGDPLFLHSLNRPATT